VPAAKVEFSRMQATRLPPQLLLQRDRFDCGRYDLSEENCADFTADFPRKAFEKRDRRAKGPRADRALELPA
jgi:hypothetical protein